MDAYLQEKTNLALLNVKSHAFKGGMLERQELLINLSKNVMMEILLRMMDVPHYVK